MYVPNGIIASAWASLTANFEFNTTMKALEPYKNQVTVLSNLAQIQGRSFGDGGGDHARAGASWLTGVHPKKTEGADIRSGISADQIAARALGAKTSLPPLRSEWKRRAWRVAAIRAIAARTPTLFRGAAPTTPLPMEANPRTLFERLFGDGDSTDAGGPHAALKERGSISTIVAGSIDRLETRPRYRRPPKLIGVSGSGSRYRAPYSKGGRAERVHEDARPRTPDRLASGFEDHAQAHDRFEVMAFQADLSRVVTFMMAREGSNRSYREIESQTDITTAPTIRTTPKRSRPPQDQHVPCEQFAYLIEKMKATPDGDGTLLDHSLIMYGSSLSDGNRHTHTNLPTMLIGGASGKLKGGRYIQCADETPMNNLLLSMLEKADVATDKLGDSTGKLQHLSEI